MDTPQDAPPETLPVVEAKPKKANKAKTPAAFKRKLFAERYIVNGNNGAEAAIFAGYTPKTANREAYRLLQEPQVKALVEKSVAKVMVKAELSTERWAQEMACIAHFDPGELYDEKGDLIPLHQLPEHVRRAISSIDVEKRTIAGKEGGPEILSTTTKVKILDKNVALANVGKHLGVFEEDNRQKDKSIKVLVQLLG